MIQKRPKDFVEFHDGEKEFCPESGPLNSRKISAPSAAIAALVTSIATAATVYTLVLAPVFAFIPELVSVVANVVKIETRIENLPEEASVIYTLSLEDDPNEIVFSGEIKKSADQLKFSDLQYDIEYVVTFYLKENDSKEFLKEIKFKTGKEEIDIPVDPIVPEIPDEPIVPSPPVEPNVPEQPVVPNPPVEPEVPDEPEIPETPVTEITVVGAEYDSAKTVINSEEEIEGYTFEETHTFTNVPSNEYTIQITQNGPVTTYSNVYDEATQTVTISFSGNTISLGETSTSNVVLIYKDGASATSANTITTPKLTAVTIEVTDNQDGSYTYTMNGEGVDPSIGDVEVNVLALNDVNNLSTNPVTQTYIMDSANFTQSFTSHVNAYGETLTAVVEVELIWSLDELAIGQFVMDEVEYRIEDISELTFTDVTNVDGYAFSYTVNAKFANLLNATPVAMDMYIQTYNTLFDEVYEEELVTTLDASQIVKDDNGNITASYISDYLLGSEQDGHKWRIVLTYIDATNTTQTMEITNHIEPFDPVFNHLNSIMWQENGITYAEYEQVFSLSPTLLFKDVALVDADVSGWDVLSSEVEITDAFGYIRGRMSSDSQRGLELHAYLDWLATDYEEMIYTGCAGAGYLESSRTNQQLVPNSTNTGYDEVIEEFTFVDGTSMLDDFGQQHVLVTLADGSQIKVTQTEANASGTVTVNWDDNNNIVVTVNQGSVAVGQSTVVDFVYEMVRDEPEMMGEVNHYTYRCFSNYE